MYYGSSNPVDDQEVQSFEEVELSEETKMFLGSIVSRIDLPMDGTTEIDRENKDKHQDSDGYGEWFW